MTSLVLARVAVCFRSRTEIGLDCSRAGREKNIFGAEASETRFFSVRTLKRVTKKFATIYSGFSSISIPFFLFFAARTQKWTSSHYILSRSNRVSCVFIFFVIFFFQFIHSMKRTSPTWLLCLALALNGKRGRERGRGEINLMNKVEPVWYGRKSYEHENCWFSRRSFAFQSYQWKTFLKASRNYETAKRDRF